MDTQQKQTTAEQLLVVTDPSSRRFVLRLLAAGSAALVLPLLAGQVRADADNAAARGFIESKLGALRKELRKPRSAKRDERLTKIFDGMLDYDHFTRATLGKHYAKLKPEQVERFSKVLRQLFQRAYTEKLKHPDRYRIEYIGESQAEQGTLVRTKIQDLKSSDEPLVVSYVVARVNGRWMARDIVTESVSLANNYRKQFGRILKKDGGFEILLGKMTKRLERS